MRLSNHPVFRRFWYPTLRMSALDEGPQPFTLLGERIVVWRAADGAPVAMIDRCPHRGVALSIDSKVVDGALRCGYHGWRWGADGACVEIPQMPGTTPSGHLKCVKRFRAEAKYGYAWVCLDEPLEGIPPLPHADEPGWRQILEFDQDWKVPMPRIVENALDVAHVSFVHTGTFGTDAKPVFPKLEIIDTPAELGFRANYAVVNPVEQQQNLGIAEATTYRRTKILAYLPGGFSIEITYPNGVVHQIIGFATPIDDGTVRRIQFVYRNDGEAESPAENIAAFDLKVQTEDRRLLESMDADFPLNPRAEAQMPMDRPGLLMRERLARLILAHDPNAHLVRAELGMGAEAAAPRLASAQ